MGSWTEQAAACAVELAEELTTGEGVGQSARAAQHLTYLAGLLRGGATPEPISATWERMKARARDQVPASDNDSEFATYRGILATERGARQRAERQRDELLAAVRAHLATIEIVSDEPSWTLAAIVDRIEKATE